MLISPTSPDAAIRKIAREHVAYKGDAYLYGCFEFDTDEKVARCWVKKGVEAGDEQPKADGYEMREFGRRVLVYFGARMVPLAEHNQREAVTATATASAESA